MKLLTKLALVGAVAPVVALASATLLGGQLLQRSLRADLDDHLRTQAAVEATSMFDGPHGKPHVHPPGSALPPRIRFATAHSAVYDAGGTRLATSAESSPAPPSLQLHAPAGTSQLTDIQLAGSTFRQMTVVVADEHGTPYTLWLALPLATVYETVDRYHRSIGIALGAVALVLFGIVAVVTRRLRYRINTLVGAMPALQHGSLARAPLEGNDELAQLGATMAAASAHVQAANAQRERFLSAAAHELRTPITIISTEVQLALRRPREVDDYIATLSAVLAQANRVTGLATSLLDREANRQGAEVAIRNLVASVEEAAAGFAVVAGANHVQLQVIAAAPTLYAAYDERIFRQALDNVIDNAIKFAPPASTIAIAVAPQPAAAPERTAARAHHVAPERIVVSVQDAGPGVPLAQQEAMFEPFVRGVTDVRGSGLGLTIVREAMQQLGGTARFDAGCSQGTRILLELPAAA